MGVLLSLFLGLSIGIASAEHAELLFIQNFHLHDFDTAILRMLGYDIGSLTYWRELASVTEAQRSTSKAYEQIGCFPFYIMRDGKSEEFGLNCRTFFCAGYRKKVVQCQKIDGLAYGGEVEIHRRKAQKNQGVNFLGQRYFDAFPPAEQSADMRTGIEELIPVLCRPYYQVEFSDVVLGEGYACEEVGQYPYYSNAHSCVRDFRKNDGFVCTPAVREDEMDVRREAVAIRRLSSSSSSGERSSSSLTEEEPPSSPFTDLDPSHEAFTAITTLAERGIIQGYRDGTYRPEQTINRAELLKLLVAGLHPGELRGETECFPDVRNAWFSPYVCTGKRLGWVQGYPDGRYRPEQTVNRVEAMKMIMASLFTDFYSESPLPRDVTPHGWFALYVRRAVEAGIVSGDELFRPAADMTRADTALWIHRAMQTEAAGASLSESESMVEESL